MTELGGLKIGCSILLLCVATSTGACAQFFTVLKDFKGRNGATPQSSLVQGADGSLYGTTTNGGDASYNGGTVFKISPEGKLTTLYDFCSQANCIDGSQPYAALLLATDGNFYGTTFAGGQGGAGTVFKITPQGSLTTLHSFDGYDGYSPFSPLIQAADGDLYGTTNSDAENIAGTVFKITLAGKFVTLHQFHGADGASPYGPLIQATDGNFYGTTWEGGAYVNCYTGLGCGTIFRITSSGTLTTLYSFCAHTNCPDGRHPTGGLIQAPDGYLYGTTNEGGSDLFYGTIFRSTTEGKLTTLHSFDGFDGTYPYGPLLLATDGNLYGTAAWGGAGHGGTIFQVVPGGVLTTLHNFTEDDGTFPVDGLLQATDGALYGTTSQGDGLTCFGRGCGTVFSLSTGLAPFVSLVHDSGRVGQTGGILGQGLTGTTSVVLNGVPTSFKVISDTFIKTTVPPGATTGYVTVTTPSGTLTSNVPFHVIP